MPQDSKHTEEIEEIEDNDLPSTPPKIEQEEINRAPELYLKLYDIIRVEKFCLECIGRQFSYLATYTDNTQRAKALLLGLTMECHRLLKMSTLETKYLIFNQDPIDILNIIAISTRFEPALHLLQNLETSVEIKPAIPIDTSEAKECILCNGLLLPASVEKITQQIVEKVHLYDFNTFLLGNNLNPELENREEELRAKFNLQMGESFKANLNRVVGKALQAKMNQKADFSNPQLRVLLDLRNYPNIMINISTESIYILGKYLKFSRKLPQTHWKCYRCFGTGYLKKTHEVCPNCGGKGEFYPTSLHDLIDEVFTPVMGGTKSILHSAGRENVETQSLGSGRPFLLEVKNPKIRNYDLKQLETQINQKNFKDFIIKDLSFGSKENIQKIKQYHRKNTVHHQGLICFSEFIPESDFLSKTRQIISELVNKQVTQRTPLRLIVHRKDQTRIKRVYSLSLKYIDALHCFMDLVVDSGLFIHEFITGDNYRTSPALATFFGCSLKMEEHNVIF